jgi:hypothetical protein
VDVGLKEKTPAQLEREWNRQKQQPVEGAPSDLPYKLMLGTLAAAGTYGVYRGSRKIQPIYRGKVMYHQNKSAGIDRLSAAQFMGWLEYGRYDGKIGGGRPPSTDSIHDETLRDVARGAFPDGPLNPGEGTALRHFTKATLAKRAHDQQ